MHFLTLLYMFYFPCNKTMEYCFSKLQWAFLNLSSLDLWT